MVTITAGAWEQARRALLERWEEILKRIDARDESGTLELINCMDEFCDLAVIEKARRGSAASASALPPVPREHADSRCEFCRGFIDLGGCAGPINDIDRAVLSRDWKRARVTAERYRRRVEAMKLQGR